MQRPVPSLTEAEIKAVFRALDIDNSGTLSENEMVDGMRSLGLRPSVEASGELWDNLLENDQDNDGFISFEEFRTFVLFREKEMRRIFEEIDLDHDGVLVVEEVIAALEKYGVRASRKVVSQRMNELDRITGADGRISFEDFRRMTLLFPSRRVEKMFQEDGKQWHFGYYSIPKHDHKDSSHSAVTVFCAGGMAGFVSRTLTAPADRIKVTLQASSKSGESITSVVRAILKEGGVSGFWKGNGANVLKIMPESACKFYANDFFKSRIVVDPDDIRPHERLLAGSMAGVTAQTLIYPMEVVKTRLAVAEKGLYSGIGGCFKKIVGVEGPASLYRGLLASNLGIIPYAGVDLAVYGTLKASWTTKHPDKEPAWYELLAMGSISSFTGQICAYPLQLVRTRLQSSGLPGFPAYTGMRHVAQDVMRTQGVTGFYKGIGANFMKGIPAVAIGYVAYEKSIKAFGPVFD
jgi:solute carrier family 25 phosphate transporter 23/24/25/41